MLKSYLKIAFRNMMKSKMVSFINIAGLSIGLAIVLLIFLNVQYQFSFNKFHKKHNRIYLAKIGNYYSTPTAFADYVSSNIPEVENSVRFEYWEGRKVALAYNNKAVIVKNIIYTDPSVFDIFSFKFISGSAVNALNNSYSLVLCESESKKLFGSENPVGKVVQYDNKYDYTITGVIEDTPANSSFIYGGFAAYKDRSQFAQNWNGDYYQSYFLFRENQKASVVESKIKTLITQFLTSQGIKDASVKYPVSLLSLDDMYFNIEIPEGYRHGKKELVYLFIAIGLLILFLAVSNYINLATASAATRIKEIAIRKTIGSNKRQLVVQFLFESLVMSILAAATGIFLLELSLPLINQYFSASIVFEPFRNPLLLLPVLAGSLLVGLIAGFFPAFYLTSISTIHAVKGIGLQIGSGFNLRKLLIMFQFLISIILLIATLVIMKQREFIQTKNMGFDEKQIVWFDLNNNIEKNKDAFRVMLMKNPNVLNVSYTKFNEADANNSWAGIYEGQDISVHPFWVDQNYINTLGIN